MIAIFSRVVTHGYFSIGNDQGKTSGTPTRDGHASRPRAPVPYSVPDSLVVGPLLPLPSLPVTDAAPLSIPPPRLPQGAVFFSRRAGSAALFRSPVPLYRPRASPPRRRASPGSRRAASTAAWPHHAAAVGGVHPVLRSPSTVFIRPALPSTSTRFPSTALRFPPPIRPQFLSNRPGVASIGSPRARFAPVLPPLCSPRRRDPSGCGFSRLVPRAPSIAPPPVKQVTTPPSPCRCPTSSSMCVGVCLCLCAGHLIQYQFVSLDLFLHP